MHGACRHCWQAGEYLCVVTFASGCWPMVGVGRNMSYTSGYRVSDPASSPFRPVLFLMVGRGGAINKMGCQARAIMGQRTRSKWSCPGPVPVLAGIWVE